MIVSTLVLVILIRAFIQLCTRMIQLTIYGSFFSVIDLSLMYLQLPEGAFSFKGHKAANKQDRKKEGKCL